MTRLLRPLWEKLRGDPRSNTALDAELTALQAAIDAIDGVTLPIEQSDVTGLVDDLAGKADFVRIEADPLNGQLSSYEITGSLFADGEQAIPISVPISIQNESTYRWSDGTNVLDNSGGQWLLNLNGNSWLSVETIETSPEDCGWTTQGQNNGTPIFDFTAGIEATTGQFALVDDGTNPPAMWKNLGTDVAPDWVEMTDGGGGSSDFLSILTAAEISITGATTATIGRMHVCSGTSADYTVTLPAASGNAGKFIGVRMSSALTKFVTIDANSTELIDGQQTRVMWAGESAILLCDGTGWAKISGKSIPMRGLMAASANVSANNATETLIPIDVALVDIGNVDDAAGKRINVRRSGLFTVATSVRYLSLPSNAARLSSYVAINGAIYSYPHVSEVSGLSGGVPTVIHRSVASFSAGDYLQLYCYQLSGSTLTAAGNSTTGASWMEIIEELSW